MLLWYICKCLLKCVSKWIIYLLYYLIIILFILYLNIIYLILIHYNVKCEWHFGLYFVQFWYRRWVATCVISALKQNQVFGLVSYVPQPQNLFLSFTLTSLSDLWLSLLRFLGGCSAAHRHAALFLLRTTIVSYRNQDSAEAKREHGKLISDHPQKKIGQ